MLFLSIFGYCQTKPSLNNQAEKLQNKWFDSIIGQKNLAINLGAKYFKKTRTIEGNHEYFLTYKFMPGDIHYNQQTYYNTNVKYDLFDDHLIVQIVKGFEKHSLILEKNAIQYFYLAGKKFTNTFSKFGFAEKIKEGKIALYKKHFKQQYEKLGKDYEYSEYRDESYFLINYKNTFYAVKEKENLIKTFPHLKEQINKFYQNNSESTTTQQAFMVRLISEIELLLTEKN